MVREITSLSTPSAWDVTIIGAGPAGLSAALVLGRCRRRVLVVDAGCPRNAASPVLHGFLTRDGIAPTELLRIGREQLRPYDTIVFREGQATHGRRTREQFVVRLADGTRTSGLRLFED
jgi:thioredoxin reductase